MQVIDIIKAIEAYAPSVYQESYDNSGLQVGDEHMPVKGILVSLDITEPVLEEAMAAGCNMIVAHHPLLFSGLKRISGRNYIERIVQQAIKNDIALYAAHTNLDNVADGVNAIIAGKLGLQHTSVLQPLQGTLSKLYTYVPVAHADRVRDALFAAGAGRVGKYSECSFNLSGTGTFRPGTDTNPAIGQAGGARETVEEVKLEVIIPKHTESAVLKALHHTHPYEEVAYELVAIKNVNQDLGAGKIGMLAKPMPVMEFLHFVKERMCTDCIRYTHPVMQVIERVAVCGGSGSFLLRDAVAAGADVLITADFKYHQFFDADGRIMIADIGHYESEQFTVELLGDILKKKFPNFAVLLSKLSTNPVKYFC